MYLKAPVTRVTGYDIIFPLKKIEMMYLPTSNKILNAIEKIMEF